MNRCSFRPGRRIHLIALVLAALSLLSASCGSSETTAVAASAAESTTESAAMATEDPPTVVVTTNILGDIVRNLGGDTIEVITIMPVGADPHDFQASAQEVAQIGNADAIISNGAAFEEGLLDILESAEGDGVPLFEAISVVDTIMFGETGGAHDDHDEHDEEHAEHEHEDEDHADEHDDHQEEHDEHDEEHIDEDHADEHKDEGHDDHAEHDDHGHDADADDPHFFVDPARMSVAADGIRDFLITNVSGIDADAMNANATSYIAELEALDSEVEQVLSAVPEDRRILVTNHEVFGYFADRYGFEVVGTVIPGGSTSDGVSAQALAELAETIEHEGVPAIFADVASSDELAQTLASEVGDVAVIELFSESLGPVGSGGATYLDMVRTNAERIAGALAS